MFEVQKDSEARLNPWKGFLDIHEAYTRPSDTKHHIYYSWRNWFFNNEDETFKVHDFGVISHNCFSFTLGAVVELNDELYNITITQAHNRISKIL